MSLRVYYEVLNQKGSPALYTDTLSNRPAFGFQGRLFISTDSGQIFEDTGSAWTLVADAGVGGGTLSSVCTNGNTTATGIVITAGGLTANTIIKSGGTASQFLKADGSVDSTSYLALSGGTMTGNLDLPANNTIGGTNLYIGQAFATTDYWRIYGNTTGADIGEMIFELGDNSTTYPLGGQRYRFFLSNSGGGISPKDALIIDYDNATFTTDIVGTNAILNQVKAVGSGGLSFNANSGTQIAIMGAGGGANVTFLGGISGTSASFSSTVTGSSLIKSGGTSVQILAADGSVITAGTNITISGGTIAASGGGGGMAIGGSITSATQGSVLFVGASGVLAQDNTNFFFDNTNERLGIGTATPQVSLSLVSSGDNFGLFIGPNAGGTSGQRLKLGYFGTGNYSVIQSIQDGTAATNLVLQKDGGFIGIGTTSPDCQLVINGSSNSRFNFRTGNVRYGTIYSDAGLLAISTITAIPLVFGINDVEKIRISSSGNLLVSTTTDNAQGKLQINGGLTASAISVSGATYTVSATLSQQYYHVFNGSTGQTLTLPTPLNNNYQYVVINNTSNTVTLSAATSTNIITTTGTSVASITLIANQRVFVIADGNNKYYQIF